MYRFLGLRRGIEAFGSVITVPAPLQEQQEQQQQQQQQQGDSCDSHAFDTSNLYGLARGGSVIGDDIDELFSGQDGLIGGVDDGQQPPSKQARLL